MNKSKFNIGDIVKIDYHVDWVAGYIIGIHEFVINSRDFEEIDYYYDVVDFFDGKKDERINENWITLLEEQDVILINEAKDKFFNKPK